MGWEKINRGLLAIQLSVLCILGLFLTSCEVINPEENIPAYIYIEKFNLNVNETIYGSQEQNISDVWFYVDGNLTGVYELPASFPVYKSGIRKVQISAGVINNGMQSTRIPYPFFTLYSDEQYEFKPGKTDTLTPEISYIPESNINIWIEDFETGNKLSSLSSSDTSVVRIQNDVFEGKWSGAIFLDPTHILFEGVSAENFVLNNVNSPVFAEIHYKTNNNFSIGILGRAGSTLTKVYNLTIVPKTDGKGNLIWNKIYINLKPLFTDPSYPVFESFQLLIGATKSPETEKAEIFMDNIKLLWYK